MIVIGSDHGGFELKSAVKKFLASRGLSCLDVGTDNGDSVDYPDFAEQVARQVSTGASEKGILICGTGIGMSIVANKFPGVRAALATDPQMARLAKEHNNANILVLGGRILNEDVAVDMVQAWLETAFEAGRHQRRLDKISALERELCSKG
ncbi:MAG TPA: ribose 5-phosphate isomerase B [Geobacterales bacterium]|nr:ribose 5-phosphate isomerase B [Geobacterales bacterium]